MKKIFLLVTSISLSLLILFVPKAHAYTLSQSAGTFYNRVTASVGTADMLDISTTYIEFMYYNLGTDTLNYTTRLVFSNDIPTSTIPIINYYPKDIKLYVNFYNSSNVLLYSHESYYNQSISFTYFETNFTPSYVITDIEYFTIRLDDYSSNTEEELLLNVMHGLIMEKGNTIINQTIAVNQYTNGWNDAMNSKVTQIWSLWGNIFDTFMSVFDIFSIQLMGDITIGHLAMVPLVLGLIGFIYALGGKRGR